MQPAEFHALTAREFERLCAGALWRQERAYDMAALVAMHLMNASGNMKDRVTVKKLLGRELGQSTVPGYETAD